LDGQSPTSPSLKSPEFEKMEELPELNKESTRPQLHCAKRHLRLVTLPFHGSRKSKQHKDESSKSPEQQIRLTRIEQGKEAIQRSTPDELANIIARFKEMACETSVRQELYQQAVEKAIKKGFAASDEEIGDVDGRYARDLEMAINLSREVTLTP